MKKDLITIISSNDIQALSVAKSILENPSYIIKLMDYVGKPIEFAIDNLPIEKDTFNSIVKKALNKSLDVAIYTIDKDTHASSFFNKCLVGTSGACGGFFGLPALTIELPISTTIILREIANIAQREGFNLEHIETKLSCMEVFALGGKSKDDDEADSAYYAIRAGLACEVKEAMVYLAKGIEKETTPVLIKVIEAIAVRYGVVVSEKVVAQALPVIGASFGASINLLFINHFQDMAQGHFTVKRLEKKYGEDKIRNIYIGL